jgi:hypothetical protein
MTKDDCWLAAKILFGLPLLFYALLSVLEPEKEIWRKPTKKVLTVFFIAWGAVSASLCSFWFGMLTGSEALRTGTHTSPVTAF